MTPEEELQNLIDRLDSLRFVETSEGLVLKADDQANFQQITLEATSLLDGVLGRGNRFSPAVTAAIIDGSGGFFGGPSYKCLREVQGILRAGIRELERGQATAPGVSVNKKPHSFISTERLEEFRAVSAKGYDFTKLTRLCAELNTAYDNDSYMSIGMLVRAIVDHIPPVFGAKSLTEIANNYRGSSSFKSAMQHLDKSLRNAADSFLHTQIRSKEVLPSFQQVDFRADLDSLLAEIVRILK